MTADNLSRSANGRAEVFPGAVLVITTSGAEAQLRAEVAALRPQALGEVPVEGGLALVFPETHALLALEGAAAVLRAAAQDGWTGAAALVTGRVGQLQAPGQAPGFMGPALERAEALRGLLHGQPGALLCDDEAARLSGLTTTTAPLLGGSRSLGAAGGAVTLCHEVLWDRLRPGDLQAPRVTGAGPRARAARPARDEAPDPGARADTPLSRWVRGTVLRTGRTFGFLEDQGGMIYYFQPRNLAVDVPLRRGARVLFRVLPPLRGAEEQRAEDVFVLGAVTDGVVERLDPRGWALVRVDCHNGLEHRLFVQNAAGAGWRTGQTVFCRIGANRQGPVGFPVEEAPDPDPATRAGSV
ncbi:hypothetical protein [Deinococcus planocerae]|uniref:hypothetical protein n=1 Tax=Deinococcus planocerae TaxID=1737569 RepID=UPI000C7F5616|nr:hypothetical protein [Deinococcus planocerae]